LQNPSLSICGKCSRHCEFCGERLGELNYMQVCGYCKTGRILGKATQKLGIDRISKELLRTLFSRKKN